MSWARQAREARERKRKAERREAIVQEIQPFLLGALLALLTFLAGLVVGYFVPPQIINLLPNSIVVALNFLDWRLVASQGLIDSTLGVFIGVVLWRTLGQKKQNIIAQSEAMIKYYHLRVTERNDNVYLIDLTEEKKQGYKIPVWARGLADEGLIRDADESEAKDVSWNDREPSTKEVHL